MIRAPAAAALAFGLAVAACSSSTASNSGAFASAPASTVDGASHVARVALYTTTGSFPARGVSRVELLVTRIADGAPVDGASLEIVPWMPVMAHGASVKPTVAAAGSGKYVVDDVDLFMPGRWELRVAVRGPIEDDATFAFDVD